MTTIEAIAAYENADSSLKGLLQANADAQAKAASAAAAATQTASAQSDGITVKRGAIQAILDTFSAELASLPGTGIGQTPPPPPPPPPAI